MLRHRRSFPALPVAALLGALLALLVVLYFEPDERQAEAEAKTQGHKEAAEVLASDRVAYYTKVLAVFTAALLGAGGIQSVLIYKQIQLGRDEFNATHRPRFIVRGFQLHGQITAGEQICPVFVAQNIGDLPGTLIEVRSATVTFGSGEALPTNLSFRFAETIFGVLASGGGKVLVPANGGHIPDSGEVFQIIEGTRFLYCMGTLTYAGTERADQRELGFCRRLIYPDIWEPVECEYEYAY